MTIVRYFTQNGNKVYDVVQALHDGWGLGLESFTSDMCGKMLRDRHDPTSCITVSSIKYSLSMGMYFVHYAESGWQCLDHAVEQYEIAGES